MKTLRHPVIGLVIFVMLVSLCVTIYSGFEDKYAITETGTQVINGTNGNIVDHLSELHILTTIENFKSAIQHIVAPQGITDLLGALASAAIGILELIWGIFAFPLEIMNIVLLFYNVPGIIVVGINLIILLYVAFIILSAYLRSDI